jgi:hypothetical protein
MEDDPIARKRSRGGHLDVGDGTDGAIISMMNIGPRTFVIKEKSIYEIIMADDIDPERTNIQVPNMVHKLVLSEGIDSEVVSQIFLTGTMFFKKDRFPEQQLVRIWELLIELTKEAINLKKHLYDYYDKEQAANEKYETARANHQAPALPTIVDLETSLKTIFQKAEHMYQIMIELSSTIMPELKLKPLAHFSTFSTEVSRLFGEKHGFSIFLAENLDFLKAIKEVRNGLDHRQPKVTLWDYQFNSDTTVSLPSISVNAKDVKFDKTPVSAYLNKLESIFSLAEVLICHLANITAQGMLGGEIREIPEDQRTYKYVRYCFYLPGLDYYEQ